MYSLTFKLQPAAVVCNLNRSFARNSRFIQPNGHSAIQISNKDWLYWLRVIALSAIYVTKIRPPRQDSDKHWQQLI